MNHIKKKDTNVYLKIFLNKQKVKGCNLKGEKFRSKSTKIYNI